MRTIIAVAMGAAMLASTPAAAAPDDLVIKFNDLDLSTAKGQAKLDRRIDQAVKKYCGLDVQATGTRMKSQAAEACKSDATRLARQQVERLTGAAQSGG